MLTSPEINAIAAALAKAQGEFGPILMNKKNPHFKSKYADISSINTATRPALCKHGITVLQSASVEGDYVHIETLLAHSSGQYLSSTLKIRTEKSTPQGIGSTITYGRRYALSAMLEVTGDEEDDGEATTDHYEKDKRKESYSRSPSPALDVFEVAKHSAQLFAYLSEQYPNATPEWYEAVQGCMLGKTFNKAMVQLAVQYVIDKFSS